MLNRAARLNGENAVLHHGNLVVLTMTDRGGSPLTHPVNRQDGSFLER